MNNSVILEIRAGAGGDEAGLFAGSLQRMYKRYAETQGWKVKELSKSEGDLGNIKETDFEITNAKSPTPNLYELFKSESGVHRVQRVPKTEKAGRIHTSTATVETMHVAICAACHPVFTGQEKLVDTEGLVQKFQKREKASKDLQKTKGEKKVEKETKEKETTARPRTLKDMLAYAKKQQGL